VSQDGRSDILVGDGGSEPKDVAQEQADHSSATKQSLDGLSPGDLVALWRDINLSVLLVLASQQNVRA